MRVALKEIADSWLGEGGRLPAAISVRIHLRPADGPDGVVFPPTFAPAEGSTAKKSDYVLDQLPSGLSCLMDSVGSQANRMEAIFKTNPYSALVPHVTVRAGSKTVDLLDAGHRAADAIVRYSDLSTQVNDAFTAWTSEGDSMGLAKLAPTSLVFGVWDSRETQAKVPRLVNSTIRAFDVVPLSRAGQYLPPVNYAAEGLLDAKITPDQQSELGLSHAPHSGRGGVLVRGEIRRDALLSLVAVRDLRAKEAGKTLPLRRYVLGLGLVALTAPQRAQLRQGCLLVQDASKPPSSMLVFADGRDEPISIDHEEALRYATDMAAQFGVGPSVSATFDPAKVTEGQAKRARKGKAKEA